MENKNTFYLFKETKLTIVPNCAYSNLTGELSNNQEGACAILKFSVYGYNRIKIDNINFVHALGYMAIWDSENNYVGSNIILQESESAVDIKIPENAYSIAFSFYDTDVESRTDLNLRFGRIIHPHYKELKKKYKKETGQVFFRESLDGKISLFGTDYELINSGTVEDNFSIEVCRNLLQEDYLYIAASFNKSDCKIDHSGKSVELKLTYYDKYSKILDAYENTYDLIKLAPVIIPLTLTKRCVAQIYIQGENVISSYAGGTYWETEVDEPVDSENELERRYYFKKGPKYIEISLEGFNYDINAAYRGLPDNNIWNAVSPKIIDGQKYKMPCSIVFNKVYNAGDVVPGSISASNVRIMSTDRQGGILDTNSISVFTYDTYKIEIWTGQNGSGTKIYESSHYYGKDGDFILAQGEDLYAMEKISQPVPAQEPEPASFYLGNFVIEYQIWGRLLCDVEKISDGDGGYIDTYDLPRDDFATPRRNYRKCIGLVGFDESTSVIKIWHSQNKSQEPTSYGVDDFGEYFVPPTLYYEQYFYPLARNSWGNTSMWVLLDERIPAFGFENWCSRSYKEYTLKNSYHIGDVIKALISKIDPTIKHEKTAEYSQFLYGRTGITSAALGNCDLYITQKTNILKGEYDQAAQKAEIKLQQVMDMLRDCFRCYWYIDGDKLKIEHISYFINGLSYQLPSAQFNLTTKLDKFNKKQALYGQSQVEYDKSDLPSRYEFSWMDDVTDSMGNLHIDVKNSYIQKDKTEEINVDNFTTDIDYMMFLPEDFSDDGFALILAENGKVPIIHQQIKDEKQNNISRDVYVQNWYASWNQLAWHYMKDLSGNNIEYNNISSLHVSNVKRCMKQNVSFPSSDLDINIYRPITTDFGVGYIEEVSISIDVNLAEIQLRYEPS